MEKIKSLGLIFLLLAATSCDDIVEKDLSRIFVEIYSPPDNYVTTAQTQTFWWEERKGISVRFQVVSGSFQLPASFIIDTLLAADRFVMTLAPGQYEWRIAAENSTSRSPFNTHRLTIDTTTDLSGQVLLLNAPTSGTSVNTLTTLLAWHPLTAATSYQVQVAMPDFSNTSFIVTDTITQSASLSFLAATEGTWSWRVKAINNQSETAFTSAWTFTTDTTRPGSPVLQQPAYNSIVNTQPFQMNWLRDNASQLSPLLGDSIYLYSDSLVTPFTSPFFVTSTVLTDSLPMGTYYWRVRTMDGAGNSGNFSSTGKFTVQ